MKKDLNDNRILRFLLEQQLPEARVAGNPLPPTVPDAVAVTAVDHVAQVALEACNCVHLQEHLPHLLDLELYKSRQHPRGWIVANPVHSLHLATQLEDQVPSYELDKQPPSLYGEEQQRTMALSGEGIVEYWCPLRADNMAPEKLDNLKNHKPPAVMTEGPQKSYSSLLSTPTVKSTLSDASTEAPVGKSTARAAVASSGATTSSKDDDEAQPETVPSNTQGNDKMDTTEKADIVATSSDTRAATPNDAPAEDDKDPSSEKKSSSSTDGDAPKEEDMKEDQPKDSESKKEGIKVEALPTTSAADEDEESSQDVKAESSSKDADTPEPSELEDKEVVPDDDSSTKTETKVKKADDASQTNAEDNTKEEMKAGDETKESEKEKSTEEDAMDVDDAKKEVTNTNVKESEEVTLKAKEEGGDVSIPKEDTDKDASKDAVMKDADDDETAKTTEEIPTETTKEIPESVTTSESKNAELKDDEIKDGSDGVKPVNVVSSSDPAASAAAPPNEVHKTPPSPPEVVLGEIPLELPEERYKELRSEEDRIRLLRRSLASHRVLPKRKVDPKKRSDPKKKQKRDSSIRGSGLVGFNASNTKEITEDEEKQWGEAMESSKVKVERWMTSFRTCRETFWNERERQLVPASKSTPGFYLPQDHLSASASFRCCEVCSGESNSNKYWEGTTKKTRKPRRRFTGDDVMQCLDCNFVGCSPRSITRDSRQHILQHLLVTGHKFAVSCGERAQIFCFCCGDFVYHQVFEQEKTRIDYSKEVPNMAWRAHQLYRSFDPFQFIRTQDHGIVWRGLVATYPQLVPQEHIQATRATSRRQALFNGNVNEKWLASSPTALKLAASQSLLLDSEKHLIRAPVGMYNLGNTCYKSAVLQCLVHCLPLQQFFVKENGHNHHACKLYRQWDIFRQKKKRSLLKPKETICLACEMDRLFLSYYGSTTGDDVRGAVEEVCARDGAVVEFNEPPEKGDPLVISEMLTASWQSGGMNSVASYKQHDSHEFLNSFLELVGKQTKQHWKRVHTAINFVKPNNAVTEHPDESKHST